ncbi:MAG: DUF1302 domain-containing protein [Alphaproteobacteria bacterium]|nr:DUF1302 domain-containing protein [Alphaproteobacteria bacterium]
MSKLFVRRLSLLGSASLGLLAALSVAQAVETKFGEVSVTFDTTVSMGASLRTADREDAFLPEGNGGPVDPRSGVGDANVIPGAASAAFLADLTPQLSFAGAGTGVMRWTNNPNNHDGSINTDDGRLNFDSGDWIGGTIKANHDLQVKYRNYTFFARAVGFYDVILNDRDAGNRSQLTDQALGDIGRNYELLDAFVSADYTIAEMPLNLRLGKQVINWGESTFILHGNNVFNPIDVGAFRRPGSEIKEALVPVNAAYGSLSLPFDVSLAGYYALDWEEFELDPSGSPFSGADIVALGSGLGGNDGRVSFLTGNPLTGMRRTCDGGVADSNGGLPLVYGAGLLPNPLVATAGVLDCLDSPFVANTVPYTIGQHEATKLGLISSLGTEGVTRVGQGIISRDGDRFANDNGQYGLSVRYFADWLEGTEFGFYYQNYHSRLPFVSEYARTMEVAVAPVSHSTQLSGASAKFATPTGCLIDSDPGVFADPRISTALLGNVGLTDPQNLLNPVSLGTAFAITGANGGVVYNSPVAGIDNIYNAAVLQCALSLFQSGTSVVAGGFPTLFDGAEILTYASDLGLYLEYPEDIPIWGGSFNTTIWGWGVQGDFTYRPDAPFQVDTDSITIAGAMEQCAFASVGDLMSTFEALGTLPGHTCFSGGSAGNQFISGVLYNEMYTAQIGTTATFTGSDWWVDAIGADIGIVVTEAGLVYVPNVEDTWLDKYDPDGLGSASPTRVFNQYQNIGCNGSDLPLGGLLGLDRKSSAQCRPNDFSAGLVLLGRIEYNNVFNSGWVLSPQIVYAYDFEGTTPSPYGNYLEDRQSVGLSITGTLNNNLRVGASYSNFFGGHVNNKAKDQDFASVTASYTF